MWVPHTVRVSFKAFMSLPIFYILCWMKKVKNKRNIYDSVSTLPEHFVLENILVARSKIPIQLQKCNLLQLTGKNVHMNENVDVSSECCLKKLSSYVE